MFGKIFCWWGWHKWGELWSEPGEHSELHEEVIFVKCRRCGDVWRII